ncbi:hypothetical protein OG233_14000 [Streptomyces sp. NBC_01218]|uniref:hypothetical protein n=1 Tax=Streptomyces sp. NBC_01218 TaxID=2903780 RepID=UPI002E15310F|nr:hypothetical protein OG233_14000 [Streptomyces sp. NBC_01218]
MSSDSDLVLQGFVLGVLLCSVVHMVWTAWAAARAAEVSAAAARDAVRRASADLFWHGFQAYRLQARLDSRDRRTA